MVLACVLVGTGRAQSVTVRGFVTDASNGQTLVGANVALRSADGELRGAVADREGFYQISSVAPGEYALRVSFVGYDAHRDTLSLGSDRFVTVSVALRPADEELGELIVEDERGAATREAGLQTIRPSDLDRVPTPDLGGDLASYLQTLPGIVSMGDRGGRLYVRGGTPAQNLVLVDGNVIYQPFHVVGFFSAFPEDLVSSVDMYAGGFGARYSGRVSSVIDVSTRHGNTERLEGSFSLSPFLAGARLEGPIHNGTSSFLASYRSSVIDHVAPLIAGAEIPVDFSDLFLKLHRTDRQNDRCSMTLVRTRDRGRLDPQEEDGEDFRWQNLVLGGQCLAFPTGSPFLFEGNAGISYVGNRVGAPGRADRSSSVTQVQMNVNFTYRTSRSELRWGLFTHGDWTAYDLGGQFQDLESDSDMLLAAGGYGEASMRFGRLEVSPGLSFTAYPFLFSPAVEPRLRFSWQPNLLRGGAWSGALGLYSQTLVGVTDERDAGSLFIAWMPAPVGGAQTKAIHALLGWRQPVASWLDVSAEAYYKKLQDLHIPIWSTIARFTTTLQLADGSSYGYDARIELDRGPLYAFAGYGYSVTRYEASQDNFGIWYGEELQRYHPPHDLRHQLTLLAGYRRGRTEASVQWQFGSGLPFTRALGFDELVTLHPPMDYRRFAGTTRVLFEKPYEGILPAYHRLDVSAERSFPTQLGTVTLQAGAVNAYNRPNIFYLDIFTLRRVDQLPLVPFAGIKVDVR